MLYKMPERQDLQNDPIPVEMRKYGYWKLCTIVKNAPIKGWEKQLSNKYKWFKKADLRELRKICDNEKKFFETKERTAYLDMILLKMSKDCADVRALKKMVRFFTVFGGLFPGVDDNFIKTLRSAHRIMRNKKSYEERISKQFNSVWKTTNKKKCSFSSSVFFKNTIKGLYEYWNIQNLESSRDVDSHAISMRKKFILDVLHAYYDISPRNQAVGKTIDRI